MTSWCQFFLFISYSNRLESVKDSSYREVLTFTVFLATIGTLSGQGILKYPCPLLFFSVRRFELLVSHEKNSSGVIIFLKSFVGSAFTRSGI